MNLYDECPCGEVKKKYSKRCRYCIAGAENFICKFCGTKFKRKSKKSGRKNMSGIRPFSSINCSKKCSKKYNESRREE